MIVTRIAIAACTLMLAVPSFAEVTPKTEEQKTLYAVGLAVARQLAVFNLTSAELELVKQGITDGVAGRKSEVQLDAYNRKIQELANGRRTARGEKLAVAAREYIEKAAREKGAVKKESGMIFLPLKEGNGTAPAATDKVKVNYRGTLVNGEEFDSSYRRGQPIEFQLDSVIKCWTEGVQMMKPGGKARMVCPPETAYGERGAGAPIPPNATLVFEVELVDVMKHDAQKPDAK